MIAPLFLAFVLKYQPFAAKKLTGDLLKIFRILPESIHRWPEMNHPAPYAPPSLKSLHQIQ